MAGTDVVSQPVELVQLEGVFAQGLPELLDELEKSLGDVCEEYAAFVAAHRDIVLGAAQDAMRALLVIAAKILAESRQAAGWDKDVDQPTPASAAECLSQQSTIAAASARIVEVATRLRQAGALSQDSVFVDEHIDAIIVHREPRLLDALRRQVLEPLDRAAPAFREPLRATLRSWLRNMGDRRAVADELHVHPQTVRYRLGRLRELFGPCLDDPDARLQLTLALAWDR